MEGKDYYLRLARSADEQVPDPRAMAVERQRLLRAWHRFEPLFCRGSRRLKGTSQIHVGKRLVDQKRNDWRQEYYITGWTDSLRFSRTAVDYTTSVQVERGWDLSS